jgi:hypothetical protein
MKTCVLLLLTVITLASVGVAQDKKAKIEIGIQTTSLTLVHPDVGFDDTQAGIGGRVTYNINRSIAAEAEINFFPQKQSILNADGRAIQAQFGVKIGKRFEKFGIFGKVRPGFLSVNRVAAFIPPPPQGSQGGTSTLPFTIERRTFFSIDAGGVLEFYPTTRSVVRFEAGDTAIRHPARFGQVSIFDPTAQLLRPAKFNHNFQFTFGVGFRLGDYPEEAPFNTSSDAQDRTRRYEIGAQFTSLFVPPKEAFGFISATVDQLHIEPGVGGRFTFNITESIAVEAEGNYFTRTLFPFPQGGHMFQGQFGAKIGKRFDSWGLFGKARPGFVGFSRVFEFPSSTQVPGALRIVKKYYPSFDVGGVVEFYVSPRWMARLDVGDTIIRYGEFRLLGLVLDQGTQHNFQFSSGFALRF